MIGELLFWISRVTPVPDVPPGVPACYRSAIAGDWRLAAEGFARHEMPCKTALAPFRGDARAVAEAGGGGCGSEPTKRSRHNCHRDSKLRAMISVMSEPFVPLKQGVCV